MKYCLLSVIAGYALGVVVQVLSPPLADYASITQTLLIALSTGIPAGILLEIIRYYYPPPVSVHYIRFVVCIGILLSFVI
ncbi:MAG: hypothetical protein QM669_13940 [Siphonobacter sp.]